MSTHEQSWMQANKIELVHSLRTTVAAVGSLLIARLFRLPESYWAAITAMIVMQSTIGAAWTISKQRLAGTALGAAMGALLATYFSTNFAPTVAIFGMGIFTLGVICILLRIERNAYRYAGITLCIVMLVTRTEPAWIIAVHRFFEISLGIAVGLLLTAVWPEPGSDAVTAAR